MAALVQLDHRGIVEVLRSQPFANAIDARTALVAAHVRRQHPDLDVVVESYTTDRAVGAVVVKDHRALGLQAKHGLLSRAAGAAGLPFSPPKR